METHEFSELVLARMVLLMDQNPPVDQNAGIWDLWREKMSVRTLDLWI